MSDGGKGCKPRPFSVTQEEYDNRWDVIFGRDKKNKDNDRPEDNDIRTNNSDAPPSEAD